MARPLLYALLALGSAGCTAQTSGLASDDPAIGVADTAIGVADTSLGGDMDTSTIDSGVTETVDSTIVVAETAMDTPTDSVLEDVADVAVDVVDACPTNSVSCAATCVDITADPGHCGMCSALPKCGLGSMCADSKCACQPGLTLCGGICIDTKGHPDACGGCGDSFKCGSGERCRAGSCVDAGDFKCPDNRPTECASTDGRKACFDTKRDPMHCGGCGSDKRCTSSELCVDGKCIGYTVGVGCTSCPCAKCDAVSGSSCCPAPAGSLPGRVFCVSAAMCPLYLP